MPTHSDGLSGDGAARTSVSWALLAVLSMASLLVTTACGSSSSGGDVPPATELAVDPAATDPAVDVSFGEHFAYLDPAVASKGKLFVFLPGTSLQPRHYRAITRVAAEEGFHSIGLAYANADPVALLCAPSEDLDCHGRIREEVWRGGDASPLVSVDRANSIESRLAMLLRHLDELDPQAGWGQFTVGDAVDWTRVRLSGHSQGGGHAGYVATRVAVDRACFFSSPADFDFRRNDVAAWMRAGRATPPERLFGFSHERDEIVRWPILQQVWPALGMDASGGFTRVDGVSPPYGGSHMLSSDREATVSYHAVTVVDGFTPLDPDGAPELRPVWEYACFL